MFSEKSLYEVKLSGLQFSFNIFRNFPYNKNKLHKVLDYLSKDMLNFDFWKKVLWIDSPPHFINKFSQRVIIKLYSINLTNMIAWLTLLLEILINMFITIFTQVLMSKPWIFLIKPFSALPKSECKSLNILRKARAFNRKWKAFSIIFKGLSFAKNCLDLRVRL